MPRDGCTLDDLVAGLATLTDEAIVVGEVARGLNDQIIVWCNPAFERMTGYAAAELIGRSPRMLRGPDSDDREVARVHAAGLTGDAGRAEILNYRKNGEPFWVEISLRHVPAGDGGAPYVVSVQRDVTERKRREAALRAALDEQSLLAAALEGVRQEIHVLDAATLRFQRVNRQARRNLGHSSRALRGMTAADILRPGDVAALRAAVAALASGAQDRAALRVRQARRDGTSYPCLSELSLLRRDGRDLIVAAVTDLTERKAAKHRLALSEQRYRMAVDASNDGIWDWDIASGTVAFSDRNRAMLGYTAEAFPDRVDSWRDRVHPDDRPRVLEETRRWLAGLAPYSSTYRMRAADGRWVWWRARGVAIRDRRGVAVRALGTNSDVTELVEAREAAEQAARLKAEFLAKMSHEIRTPLNGVLGMAELMRMVEDDPVKLSRLGAIMSAGRSLLSIIEDVLALARLGAGAEPAREAVFELAALCGSAFDPVRAAALGKGLALEADCAPGRWRSDERRLRQVLINLIGNAAKFTDAGAIRLRAGPGPAGVLRFEVADTGPGVPGALRETIFEPFRQGDDSTTRPHGGLGLGLAIAREFVMGMGGRIGVADAPGGGALFWFEAPATPVPDDAST